MWYQLTKTTFDTQGEFKEHLSDENRDVLQTGLIYELERGNRKRIDERKKVRQRIPTANLTCFNVKKTYLY